MSFKPNDMRKKYGGRVTKGVWYPPKHPRDTSSGPDRINYQVAATGTMMSMNDRIKGNDNRKEMKNVETASYKGFSL